MSIATEVAQEFDAGVVAREQVSLWRDGWRRLRRNRLALAATIFLAFLALVCVVTFFWTPYPPSVFVGNPYAGPSLAHPFGLDEYGRDMLSRMMVGAQISMAVGLGCAVIAVVVGVSLGLLAGYLRGWVDSVISTAINIFYSFPTILMALILYIVIGPSIINIMVAISLTVWMDMARLVRGQTLSIREREYVEAARASGARTGRIMLGHVLPNSLGPIIVQATYIIPSAILTEAFLSFLGVGIPPPTPDWGNILGTDGLPAIRFAPHILLPTAILLSVTLLAFNFLGDGLRDAFDPRQKR
jgi:ABC-type dipeptide/oligopeptide/nickel transport system permease subunit